MAQDSIASILLDLYSPTILCPSGDCRVWRTWVPSVSNEPMYPLQEATKQALPILSSCSLSIGAAAVELVKLGQATLRFFHFLLDAEDELRAFALGGLELDLHETPKDSKIPVSQACKSFSQKDLLLQISGVSTISCSLIVSVGGIRGAAQPKSSRCLSGAYRAMPKNPHNFTKYCHAIQVAGPTGLYVYAPPRGSQTLGCQVWRGRQTPQACQAF